MRKSLITFALVTSLVFSPRVRADDVGSEEDTPEMQTEQTQPAEVTPVGQAANESTRAAKNKQWQNIALAAGAVVVAVTALILVANNEGHKVKTSN